MKKNIIVLIIVGALLFSTACLSTSLQPNTSPTATNVSSDLYATQTALANLANIQEMANATATKMAQDFFATQTRLAYQAPAPTPATATALPIAIPTFQQQATAQAVVNIQSINVRSGPGTVYPIVGNAYKGDKLTILGQAYSCSWLKVQTPEGKTGWVSTTYVTYTMACGEIAQAPIPPEPTQAAQPTSKAGGQGPSCDNSATITITNNTGLTLTISLVGPASYSFNLGPGDNTLNVCPGTYSYSMYGCAGGSLTGTISSGEWWTFSCE